MVMSVARVLFLAVALMATPANAMQLAPGAYRQDIETFRVEMKARHANPFASLSEAEFDRRLDALSARVDQLTLSQFIVEMSRIGAALKEGHTGFFPMFDARLGLQILPIELARTSDGWTILATAPDHVELLGARLTHVGGVPMDRIETELADIYPRDTDAAIPKGIADIARTPVLLEGAGLVRRAEDARTIRIADDTGERTVRLETIPKTVDRVGVRGFLTVGGGDVLWMSRRTTPWWSATIEDGRALYIQFNSADTGRDPAWNAAAFGQFAEAFVAQVQADARITRLVLDLRWNTGGSYEQTRRLLADILRTNRFGERGSLFVLTSSRTFSAAMNHLEAIETWLDPIVVGEAGAGRPWHKTELGRLRLPNSQMEMRYATQTGFWSIEHRPHFAPHLNVMFSSADLRAGRDPVLEAVAGFDIRRSVGEEMQRALDAGGIDAALGRYSELRRIEPHRYIFEESVLNGFGHSLLESRPADALRVFQLNAAEYAHSPNVHADLGRALAALGRNAEAITAYRRAIAMDRRYTYALALIEDLERRPGSQTP